MHEAIISNWNLVVKNGDQVYILGDVCFQAQTKKKEIKEILNRLNGKKILIIGNHDKTIRDYENYFKEVCLLNIFDNYIIDSNTILTHEPLETNLGQFKTNYHGHLHLTQDHNFNPLEGVKYINVNLEFNDFKPVEYICQKDEERSFNVR